MSHSRLLSATGLTIGLALIVSGCGSSANSGAAARVSGRLTYKGQPVKAAVVNLFNADGVAYAALVSPDGTYSASDIAVGELVVTVETESLKKNLTAAGSRKDDVARMAQNMSSSKRSDNPTAASAAPPEDPATYYVKIPAKYNSPKTSPLTVTLKPGRQVMDLELVD